MNNIDRADIPEVTEHMVYEKIRKAKKPNSTAPGDLPKRIVEEFSVELALPATIIFNKSLQSLEYPSNWKKEYATPIKKVTDPEDNNDLRLISLTKFLSKVFEGFIAEWILHIVGPQLDPGQFGGLRGNSITHYLIHLINFILSNQESTSPVAVLAAIIDFSKAFNRMSSKRIITIMYEMNIPGWLLSVRLYLVCDVT